jgi:hypothetical protein
VTSQWFAFKLLSKKRLRQSAKKVLSVMEANRAVWMKGQPKNWRGAMLPTICRCCGSIMKLRAPWNPNLCLSCAETDWSELELTSLRMPAPSLAMNRALSSPQSPPELEHVLEREEPSGSEYTDAIERVCVSRLAG